jgi:ankyrin repeat protein
MGLTAGQAAGNNRVRMLAKKLRFIVAASMMSSIALSSPASAEPMPCDGNLLCVGALIPAVVIGAAIQSLKPNPPEMDAAKDIDTGNNVHLRFVLESHPDLLKDREKSQVLLQTAAYAGNLEATTILLDAGVPANYRQSAALWYATSVAEVELLLSRGASAAEMDLSFMQYRFSSPVVVDLLNTILEHRGAVDPHDRGGLSLLSSAAAQKQFAVMRLLLQHGVNPNGSADRVALIALAYACNSGDSACEAAAQSIARELIDKGANVNLAQSPHCKMPLQAAKQGRNQALIALLEAAGAKDSSDTSCLSR